MKIDWNNPEEVKAYNKAYYQKNKDKIAEQHAAYYQEHKDEIAAYNAAHKDEITERNAAYYQANKEKVAEKVVAYRQTPMGRAINLISNYKRNDKKHNRGECTLTAQWVVDNIFNQPCHYCGETDWVKLGCDRIDNSLPHTPDNVVPCCYICNCKRHLTDYDEFKNSY